MKQPDKKQCLRVKQPTRTLRALILITMIALVSQVTPVRANAAMLASVNAMPISSRAVDGALRAYLTSIGHRELPAPRMQRLREDILKRLIEEELLYQEALKEGLSVTKDDIDAGVAKIQSRFDSDQSYESAIQKEALKPGDIRFGVKRSLLINKTWSYFWKMPQAERNKKLKAMHEGADIQLHLN